MFRAFEMGVLAVMFFPESDAKIGNISEIWGKNALSTFIF
jgi:hypothetical protein